MIEHVTDKLETLIYANVKVSRHPSVIYEIRLKDVVSEIIY